jgi:hypothetical protein
MFDSGASAVVCKRRRCGSSEVCVLSFCTRCRTRQLEDTTAVMHNETQHWSTQVECVQQCSRNHSWYKRGGDPKVERVQSDPNGNDG